MRMRTRGIAFIAAVAVSTGAVATAAQRTYEGKIRGDDKAEVQLKVKVKRKGGMVVKRFTVRSFPLECQGGIRGRLQRASVSGSAPVNRKGRFTLAADNEMQSLTVRGRIKKGKASGTVEYDGMTNFITQVLNCGGNAWRWTASR